MNEQERLLQELENAQRHIAQLEETLSLLQSATLLRTEAKENKNNAQRAYDGWVLENRSLQETLLRAKDPACVMIAGDAKTRDQMFGGYLRRLQTVDGSAAQTLFKTLQDLEHGEIEADSIFRNAEAALSTWRGVTDLIAAKVTAATEVFKATTAKETLQTSLALMKNVENLKGVQNE